MDESSEGVVDPTREYAERVVAGDIITGRLVRLACERHLRDLERQEEVDFPYRFDHDAAMFGIEAFELFVHWQGEWAGQVVVLELWQMFIVGSVFGWVKKADGYRRFRRVHQEIARKNGKTLMAAGIALILAFFDGEQGAQVYSAATKQAQAKLVWLDALRMVQARPALRRHIKHWKASDTLESEASNSRFTPLGADSDTQDGLNVHAAILDELHKHRNRGVLDVLKTATGSRRQPLIWIITTAGEGQENVWWQERKMAVDVLEGVFENDRIFVYIATLDEEDDWRDPACWIKANPNLGVSIFEEQLIEEVKVAEYSSTARAAFLRLHMNMPSAGVGAWLDLESWSKCSGRAEEEELHGREAWGGLDLSSKIDLTALALAVPDPDAPGYFDMIWRFWMPADSIRDRAQEDQVPYDVWAAEGWIETTPGNVIDYSWIEEEVCRLAKVFDLREVAFDPYSATQTSIRLEGEGITMVEFRQGMLSLAEPTKEFETLVLSKKIRHDENPVARWMASNAAVHMDAAGNIKPCKKTTRQRDASARIDGVVAAIMATGRASIIEEASPYRERGVLSV